MVLPLKPWSIIVNQVNAVEVEATLRKAGLKAKLPEAGSSVHAAEWLTVACGVVSQARSCASLPAVA